MSTKSIDAEGAVVYKVGLCMASCCAPNGMTREEVEVSVNAQEPTGIQSSWQISGEDFATGQTNPCPCNTAPGTRRHWLLEC